MHEESSSHVTQTSPHFVDGLHSGAIERTISKPIDATELLGLIRVRTAKPGDPAQITAA